MQAPNGQLMEMPSEHDLEVFLEQAPLSRNRLTRRSTASLNAGRWVRTASAKVARLSASEASMSQHCSNTSSSEGVALDKIRPPNSVARMSLYRIVKRHSAP